MKTPLFLSLGVVFILGQIRTSHGVGENSVCKLLSPLAIVKLGLSTMKATMPWKPHCFFRTFLIGLMESSALEFEGPVKKVSSLINGLRGVCEVQEAISGFGEFLGCALNTSGDVDLKKASCLVFWKAVKCVPSFLRALKEFAKALPETASLLTG